MENVNLTNELIFRYQVDVTDLTETLADDLLFLKKTSRRQVSSDKFAEIIFVKNQL